MDRLSRRPDGREAASVGGTGKQEEAQGPSSTLWRWRIVLCVYAGYMCYYFTRRSFSLVLPALLRDPDFAHVTMEEVSIVGTVMSIAYSMGKIGMGLLADQLSPRLSLPLGICICAATNILLAQSSSILIFALLWAINGFLQGGGWAPCSQLLINWFPRESVGTVWGMATTSQNVGTALIAIVCSYFSELYGWRTAMCVPGAVGLFAALFVAWGIRSSPADVGLPYVNSSGVRETDTEPSDKGEGRNKSASNKHMLSELEKPGVLEVFQDSYVLLLGLASCLIYVIRVAISDWAVLYLVEDKGFSQLVAGSCVAWFEFGGIIGATVAETIFKALFLIEFVLITTDPFLCSVWIFLVGFLLYGPNMLVGIFVAEVVNPQVKTTAQGLTGAWAGIGGALANYPLALVIRFFGWSHFILVLAFCGLLTVLTVIPMWSVSRPKAKMP